MSNCFPLRHPSNYKINSSRNQNKIYDAYYVRFPEFFCFNWRDLYFCALRAYLQCNAPHWHADLEREQICLVVTHTSLPPAFITNDPLNSFYNHVPPTRVYIMQPFTRAICTLVHDKLILSSGVDRALSELTQNSLSQCLFCVILLSLCVCVNYFYERHQSQQKRSACIHFSTCQVPDWCVPRAIRVGIIVWSRMNCKKMANNLSIKSKWKTSRIFYQNRIKCLNPYRTNLIFDYCKDDFL